MALKLADRFWNSEECSPEFPNATRKESLQRVGMAENAEPHFDIQVLAALVGDAELICDSLATAGIVCRVSKSISAAAADIPERADILLLFEEALDRNSIGCLTDALRRQSPWSDLPVIVLTGGGAANRESEGLAKMREPLAGCGKTTARPKMLSRFQVLWG